VRGPGCYAYQVDGHGFSYVLVFKAVLDSAPATPSPTPDAYAELRNRPLDLPKVAPGATCPVTPPEPIKPPPPANLSAPLGLGSGPVYPVASYFGRETTLHIQGYVPGSDRWYGGKVRWIGGPGYSGPALVRGGQLDGDNKVGLSVGSTGIMTELALDVADGWNDWPSTTHVRGPGCYAYQVDGHGFSYLLVFKAVLDNSPPGSLTP
jgi:hypothetical protein